MNSIETLSQECDVLYGKIYQYNYGLMKRSEDLALEDKYSFNDIFDFYITSNMQSWLKNGFYGYWFSPGMMMNSRCIIEGLALKAMYDSGDISQDQIELLQKQVFLIEYNCYKKFSDISQEFLFPDKLRYDWEQACSYYTEKLKDKFSNQKIQKIIESSNPFLCDEKLSYHKIIETYLGKEFAIWYGILSQCSHPSDNTFYQNQNTLPLLLGIYELIRKNYGNLPDSRLTLTSYTNMCMSGEEANRFLDLVKKECSYLQGIADVFEQHFSNNYVSNTLQTLCLLMQEMAFDNLTGLNEQVKSKWKIMLELMASFYYCYLTETFTPQRYDLLVMHTDMQYSRNIEIDYDMSDAYECYKKIYPNGCDAEVFAENFRSVAGYTIDENGHYKSLSAMVRNFISEFDRSPNRDRAMYLDYFESQMISHANGYMWFANSGAFMDVNNIFSAIDIGIDLILRKMHLLFKMHSVAEESKEYKNVINVLRNTSKKLSPIFAEKYKLLLAPKIHL